MAVLPDSVRNALAFSPYSLANMADVSSPDSSTSSGAVFLSSVLSSVLEAVEYLDDQDDVSNLSDALDDRRHELADSAVPVYAHDRWLTFVDLAAYNVDVSDYGLSDYGQNGKTDRVAGVALYVVAETLIGALCEEVSAAYNAAVEEAARSADTLGEEHGHNAATFVEVPNVDTARRIMTGIEDGDPAVLDMLPAPDLSGQWADGLSVDSLMTYVDLDGVPNTSSAVDDVVAAYESAFSTAVEVEVSRACRAMLDS
jgi:hypothetical protein